MAAFYPLLMLNLIFINLFTFHFIKRRKKTTSSLLTFGMGGKSVTAKNQIELFTLPMVS